MKSAYIHSELGNINIKVNPRARHIILRARPNGVQITVPPATSEHSIQTAIKEFHDKLLAQQQSLQQRPTAISGNNLIDLNFNLHTQLLTLNIQEGNQPGFFSKGTPGKATIICPPDTHFEDSQLQEWLHKVIEKTLCKQAQWLLPPRLKELSELHALPYNCVKINASKGRWGSCSTKRNINLSCYLLTVPSHLIDYVLLHELSHTREMNHGPRFWELMDKLTDGKALALRNELKSYRTGI